jgi:hypothetical protein
MGAKRSEEMRTALKLIASGESVTQAARRSGVLPTSLHRAKRDEEMKRKRMSARLSMK